jgi:hypothetical protein
MRVLFKGVKVPMFVMSAVVDSNIIWTASNKSHIKGFVDSNHFIHCCVVFLEDLIESCIECGCDSDYIDELKDELISLNYYNEVIPSNESTNMRLRLLNGLTLPKDVYNTVCERAIQTNKPINNFYEALFAAKCVTAELKRYAEAVEDVYYLMEISEYDDLIDGQVK